MHDLPGKFIGIIIAFVLAVVVPFVNTTVQQEMLDRRSAVMDVTNFIDEVVDSRQITDAAVRELNSSLASYGTSFDYEVTHYRRTVNPDPMKSGSYYTNYIVVDSEQEWERGDRISVRLFTIGHSTTETISHKLSGLFVPELDRTIAARIR